MIVNVEGDLLEIQKKLHLDYICHQVNCQGAMNSGIAKHIRNVYPQVYDKYMKKWNMYSNTNKKALLGSIQIVSLFEDHVEKFYPHCINMFSQENYGYNGKQYTSYDAFWNCLNQIKEEISSDAKIGFPHGIGCVRGGANWHVILKMIEEVFSEHYVYIVRLGE